MKHIAIVGSGPSGLYTAKYLLPNFLVTVFEKSSQPFGLYNLFYKYQNKTKTLFKEILKHKNLSLKLNTEIKSLNNKFDAFIIATGAKPRNLDIDGKDNIIPAIEVIKNYINTEKGMLKRIYNYLTKILFTHDNLNDKYNFVNKDVLIVGCGNVTMDLINYLYGDVSRIYVLCRGGPFQISCKNAQLREIMERARKGKIKEELNKHRIDNKIVNNKYIGHNTSPKNKQNSVDNHIHGIYDSKIIRNAVEKKFRITSNVDIENEYNKTVSNLIEKRAKDTHMRRKEIFDKMFLGKQSNLLQFLFYSELNNITKCEDGKLLAQIKMKTGQASIKVDHIIESIGFVKSKTNIESQSQTPIFYTGWCNNPTGNLNDIILDARETAKKVIKTLEYN